MKRNLITILLLLCSVLLLLGSVFLYRSLTDKEQAPATNFSSEAAMLATQQPDPSDESVVVSQQEPEQGDGTFAEIVEDDSSLEAAPDFTVTDRDGVSHRLSDFSGKPVIINFWATWCGPCQAELPYFNEAFVTYGDQIQFMMVDLVDGYSETEATASAFVDANGYSFPLFFDAQGEGSYAYGISAIPLTVVINANGRIVDTHLGSMTSAQLQELIDTLLNQ